MSDTNAGLCLHIPVTLSLGQRTFAGELALPARATEVRVCIGDGTNRTGQRREARKCAERAIAALSLENAETMSSGDLLRVIDWVRSRRLLRSLPISILTASAQTRAALKAAHHRPACVSCVLVREMKAAQAMPTPMRHLRLAYSA